MSFRTASWRLAERSLTEIGLNVGVVVCAMTYHVSMIAGNRTLPWYQSRAELTLARSCGSPAGRVNQHALPIILVTDVFVGQIKTSVHGVLTWIPVGRHLVDLS